MAYWLHYQWRRQPLGRVADREIARRLGCCSNTVRKARLRLGIKPYQTMTPLKMRIRRGIVASLVKRGKKMGEIGEALGVSRQRAQQLVARWA